MSFLNGISQAMSQAEESMTSGGFLRAAGVLSESKDAAREKIQSDTAQGIKSVVQKLKGGEPLSQEDIDLMKLWIVGDAQSYAKMENNFNDWLNEFRRLKTVLAEYEGKDLSKGQLLNIQGILEDATRVAADIGNLLEKKERIKKFEEATKSPQTLDREILVDVLEQKIKSPEF